MGYTLVNGEKKGNSSRIIYIDPSSLYGEVTNTNSESARLIPDYTDMCISFNLIIQRVSRVTGELVNSVINWTNDNSEIKEGDRAKSTNVSVLSGSKLRKSVTKDDNPPRYLTTYYTDIHYNDIKNANKDFNDDVEIIEGLGVSDITISMASYYSTEVTMKFIDVRGATMFGADEHVHTDEEILQDTVFGEFFTFPYPKFTLQVKGFYGKAVSYQLSCSDFRARFNSESGNFEITVKFLGYNNGILADTPIQMMLAAPYCDYTGAGMHYWSEKIDTKEWQLYDGTTPVKLFRAMQLIKAATAKGANNSLQPTEELKVLIDKYKELSTEVKHLNKVTTAWSNFETSLKKAFEDKSFKYKNTYYEPNDKNSVNSTMIYLFLKTIDRKDGDASYPSRDILKEAIVNYNEFESKLRTFNDLYPDDKINVNNESLDISKIPFDGSGNGELKQNENNKKLGPYASIRSEINSTIKENSYKSLYNSVGSFNNDKQYFGEQVLVKNTNAKVIALKKSLGSEIEKLKKHIKKEKEKFFDANITQIVGFRPTIGNVYKTIMCHFETFIHLIYACTEEITSDVLSEGDERTLSFCGLSKRNVQGSLYENKKTKMNKLVPFPQLLREEEFDEDDSIFEIDGEESDAVVQTPTMCETWPGSFNRDSFKETKLIDALYDAVLHIKKDDETPNLQDIKPSFYHVIPCDFINNRMPNTAIESLDSLCGYLGLRVASIFGVVDNGATEKEAKLMGRLDAINYWTKMDSNKNVENKYFTPLGNGSRTNTIKNIILCNSDYDSFGSNGRHIFERSSRLHANNFRGNGLNTKYGRHPIFTTNGKEYYYTYTLDNNNNANIPVCLDYWSDLTNEKYFKEIPGEGNFTYYESQSVEEDNGYYREGDVLTTVSTKTVYSDEKLYGIENKAMFDVCLYGKYGNGNESVAYAKTINDVIESNNVGVYGYTDNDESFNELIKKYWKIDNKSYVNYLMPEFIYKTNDFNTEDNDDKKFLLNKTIGSTNSNEFNSLFYTSNNNNLSKFVEKLDSRSKLSYNEGGYFVNNDEEDAYYDYEVRSFDSYIFNSTLNNYYKVNIFGNKYYYLQNDNRTWVNSSTYKHNIYTNDFVANAAKAYLFLTTLPYNHKEIIKLNESKDDNINFLSKELKHGRIEFIPRGYILLLGAICWRERYLTLSKIGKKPNGCWNTDIFNYIENETREVPADSVPMVNLKTNNLLVGGILRNVTSTNIQYCKISEIIGYDLEQLDYNVRNVLSDKFESFVNNEFIHIKNSCELKVASGSSQNITYLPLTYNDFISLYNTIVGGMNRNMLNTLADECPFVIGRYSFIVPLSGEYGFKMFFNTENESAQERFKTLYYDRIVVTNTGIYIYDRKYDVNNANVPKCSVSEIQLNAYLEGFDYELNEIYRGVTSDIEQEDPKESDDSPDMDDFKCNMYFYLKKFWERWLMSSDKSTYKVENFFNHNFIFIDQFYRDISNILHINCDSLLKSLEQTTNDESGFLLKLLNNLSSDHRCLFFGMPDYANFNNTTPEDCYNSMKNLFTPLSYSKKNEVEFDNMYVIIHTYKPAEIPKDGTMNDYDSFNIWTSGNENNINDLRMLRDNRNPSSESLLSTYGYNVPSFGIAYGQQNNHMFKSVTVSMENPMATEQSIKTMAYISQKGRDHKLTFYGQDLYTKYNAYSYIVTVEMMGNAQILPLMYFQLMNIPMFRGTYMIFNVSHSIYPGDMTTTFKAMKMSKNAMPYSKGWFVDSDLLDNLFPIEDDGIDIGGDCFGGGEMSGFGSVTYNKTIESMGKIGNGILTDKKTGLSVLISSAKKLYEVINSWLGVPYKWGGKNKSGVDCSGFVKAVYQEAYGVTIRDGAQYQAIEMKEKHNIINNIGNLREGDLLFFNTDGNLIDKNDLTNYKNVGHVGIFLNNGVFVHASSSNGVSFARIDNSYWAKPTRTLFAGRNNYVYQKYINKEFD